MTRLAAELDSMALCSAEAAVRGHGGGVAARRVQQVVVAKVSRLLVGSVGVRCALFPLSMRSSALTDLSFSCNSISSWRVLDLAAGSVHAPGVLALYPGRILL